MRDEEWADKTFPNRGERPSDEVVVDPEAEPAPNIAHVKGEEDDNGQPDALGGVSEELDSGKDS